MNERKEIICNKCGAIYFSDEMPSGLRCICFGEEFDIIKLEA